MHDLCEFNPIADEKNAHYIPDNVPRSFIPDPYVCGQGASGLEDRDF